MRIVVHVLLCAESLAILLQLHAEHHVEVFCLVRSSFVPNAVDVELRIVSILNVVASVMSIERLVNASVQEVVVEILDSVELTLEVYHRACLALLINKVESRDVCILSHLGVVSTECRSDMYDTRTIVCSNIVAEDYAESLALHLNELVATVF